MEDIGIVNLDVTLPVMFVFVSHRKNTHIRVKSNNEYIHLFSYSTQTCYSNTCI